MLTLPPLFHPPFFLSPKGDSPTKRTYPRAMDLSIVSRGIRDYPCLGCVCTFTHMVRAITQICTRTQNLHSHIQTNTHIHTYTHPSTHIHKPVHICLLKYTNIHPQHPTFDLSPPNPPSIPRYQAWCCSSGSRKTICELLHRSRCDVRAQTIHSRSPHTSHG